MKQLLTFIAAACAVLPVALAQPVNDNFTNRIAISGAVTTVITVTGSSLNATKEPGEPNHANNQGGRSVWWTWTAPASGPVTLNDTGSNFRATLAVYTGNSFASFTTVAANANTGNGGQRLTFNAVANTTYQIAVDAFRGGGTEVPTGGNIVLNLQLVPVVITSPTNGSVIVGTPPTPINVDAIVPNPPVTRVDFYQRGSLIGSDNTPPFSLNALAVLGTNAIYAVAIDSAGLNWTSAVVNVAFLNIGVNITSPLNGQGYLNTTSVSGVTAIGYLPSGGAITNVEFFVDGQKFAEDGATPFTVAWNAASGGIHRIVATGKDNNGLSYTSAPTFITISRVLLPTNSVWKYLDDGSDQGTNWITTNFSDSSWASGPAQLGYGDGDEATVVGFGPDPNNKFITTYFRRSFVVTNAAGYSLVLLNVQRDDGAVVYLNGVEAARLNMPTGPVAYNTLAFNAGDDGSTFNLVVASGNLVEGTNVLAAEIHQNTGNSTDISFDLELQALPILLLNQAPNVALISPTNNSFLAPSSITVTAAAADSDGSVTNVEFFVDGVKIGQDATSPYSITWNNPPTGAHALLVVATDDQGAQGSALVNVLIYDAIGSPLAQITSPPNGFTAEGPTNLTILANVSAVSAITNVAFYSGNTFIGIGSLPQVTSPTADYQFQNALSSSVGTAPALANLGNNTFGLAIVDGTSRTVLRFAQNDGLSLGQASSVLPNNVFSVVMLFSFNDVSSWRRLIDFKNATSDDGLYSLNGSLYFYPTAEGTITLIPSNAFTQVVITRDASKNVAGYVNGVRQFSFVDSTDGGALNAANVLRFFRDDNSTVEASAGSVARIRIYDVALSASQVSALDRLPSGISPSGNSYSLVWSNATFGSNGLTAVAFDTQGSRGTSPVVNVTITIPPTNTVAPTIFARTPAAGANIGNLTTIQVTFSETVVGVNASDLLVNGVLASSVTGSGSNYTFTVTPPTFGTISITWAANHGITDIGYPSSLPFNATGAGAAWTYNLQDTTAPTIISRVPAANATVTNLTQIQVTFSETVTNVDASDLLINGSPAIGFAGGSSIYTFSFPQPTPGTINISWATNHGITDISPSRNAFNATAGGATWAYTFQVPPTVLVNSNAVWSFIKGTVEASTPINAWRALSFDDSSWSNSLAPFFYGDPYGSVANPGTLLSDMQGNYSSIYLRKKFVVSNAAAITNLLFPGQIDDGFIVWINGVEVLRFNMTSGDVPHDGVASTTAQESGAGGATYIIFPLPPPSGYLVEGTNILAIHAFNQSLVQSTDFGVNAQLYTYLSDPGAIPPSIASVSPAAGNVFFLTNVTVTFSESVGGVNASDLLMNGVAATGVSGGTSNTSYTFTFVQPAYGNVSLTWAAAHGITDFDSSPKPFNASAAGSTFQYTLLNPSAPTIASQVPAAGATVSSLAQVQVTFNEPVLGVDAADLRVNGAAATGVSGSGASYTFTFAQPAYGNVAISWAGNHGITDAEAPRNAFDPSRAGSTWQYTLIDQVPPTLIVKNPTAGANVTNLTQLQVTFSENVVGVNASDLLINGNPAIGVTASGTTYTFTFAQPNTSVANVSWAFNHGITDTATQPNAFDGTGAGALWQYFTPDNVPPAVAAINPPPGATVRNLTQLAVTFAEPVTGVNASDLLINNVPAQSVSGSAAGPYTFQFSQPVTGAVEILWVAAHGITDLASPPNTFGGGEWTYVLNPNAVFTDKIVINEIMFQHTSHRTNDEWIELHNTDSAPVNLNGWRLTKGVDFTFPNVTVPAGGYLVIAADTNAFRARYPAIANVVGNWVGNLGNNDQTIQLETALGENVSEVHYASEGDWGVRIRGPLLSGHRGWIWRSDADGFGKTMELMNAAMPNKYGQNWRASTPVNGTPGVANSVASTNIAPLILDMAHFPVVPRSTESVVISVRILDERTNGTTATVFYRNAATLTPGAFIQLQMFDDGVHNDGVAGDKVFAASVPAQTNDAVIEFYVRAVDLDNKANTYPPAAVDENNATNQYANALYQVDDRFYAFPQPLYKIIMTEAERQERDQIASSQPQSDAEMNCTFISVEGTGTELRYNCSIRERGAGSRGYVPANQRVNVPTDRRWKGERAFNLNTRYTHSQYAGYLLSLKSGLDTEFARIVRVRLNNRDQAGAGLPQFGCYIHVEAPNADLAKSHWPLDDGGNLYRAGGSRQATLAYLGTNAASYQNAGYDKASNNSENDWTDVSALTFALSPNTPDSNYTAAVRSIVNVEQWMLYFAMDALFDNQETTIANGDGDDYTLYFAPRERRFYFVAHDWDTVLSQGDTSGNVTDPIFRADNLPAVNRFMHWPEFTPIYYDTLRRLCATTFSPAQLGKTLDEGLGSFVPQNTINAMKTFASNRVNYVLSLLPPATNTVAVAPNLIGGTITSNVVFAATNSPYRIASTLSIANGATITIQPGTTVALNSGIGITVANGGRLIAEGTAASPILFTRNGASGNWGNITINGSVGSQETRIAYARFEFNANSANTPAVQVSAGTVFLDHLTFANTAAPYIHVDGASFVISHCEFPNATASFEMVHGNGGIKSGGRGIIYRNFFGSPIGYNDVVDFTGGQRPGPTVHFIDNVFVGATDDILDLDGTDAWVEGNIFMHAHKNGAPDTASAVSGGDDAGNASRITVIGNIIYDCDHAAMGKAGNFYTLINNTIVHQTHVGGTDTNGAVVAVADDGFGPAIGMYLEGNVLFDIESLVRFYTNQIVTYTNNLMPLAWSGPGGNNSTANPLFKHLPALAETMNFTNWASAQVFREWLSVLPGSPATGTGPNGTDKGASTPIGASVLTQAGAGPNDVVLRVGVNRTGNGIPAANWPNGSGYTHYKWRLDDGPWSAETPVGTAINLPGFRSGTHRIDVSGKRDSGLYQDDPLFGEVASVTSVFNGDAQNVRLNEVLASNQSAIPHEGTHPDLIELYNAGATAADISGLRLTDDPINPEKFTFPSGTIIPANGYLAVYANNPDGTSGIHIGFRLNKDGQSLYLYDNVDRGGALIDSVTFGLQLSDYAVGRLGTNWALCVPTAGAPNVAAATGDPTRLLINEILAAELTAFPDDFVEIYNPQSAPVAMAGLFFTDNPTHWPTRSPVPALTFIGAQSYLAFRADGDPEKGSDHLNFQLAAERGVVALLRPRMDSSLVATFNSDIEIIDSLVYGPQTTDISQGRSPSNGAQTNLFATPTPGSPNPGILFVNQGVVINEVLAANSTIREADGETPDWVEFFNLSTNAVSLSGYTFTDSTTDRTKYVFAAGSTIVGRGYLRLRCDGSTPASATNCGFNVKAESGNLYLYDSAGNLVSFVTYGLQALDFSISRIPDGTGAWALSLPTPSGANIAASLASAAAVRINEWLAAPNSGEDWFELWNPNAQPVAIGGHYLTDDLNARTKSPIPALSFLGANTNGYQRFWADSDPAAGANHANFKLSNGGESIGFANPAGTLIDSVTFGAQQTDVSEGRFPDGSATVVGFPQTPSPGDANYLPLTNVVINEALTHSDLPFEDAIELRNLTAAGVNIGGWFLSDAKGNLRKYRIPDNTFIPAGGYFVVYEFQINNDPANNPNAFSLSSASGDEIYLSTADASGNLTGYRATVDFGPAENGVPFGRYVTSDAREEFVAISARSFGQDDPGSVAQFRTGTGAANPYPKVGPVVVSQIMYHPPDSGTNDNTLDEFIELRNIASVSTPLFDPLHATNTWRLRDAVDFDFPQGVSLAANGRLILVSFDPSSNPSQLAAFRTKYGIDGAIPIYGPYSGKLANDDDKVELYKPDNPDAGFVPFVLVDRVHYRDLAPWPTSADGAGTALQRVSLAGFGNDPTNWIAGIPNFGGGGSADSDGDGIPDSWETQFGLNPNNASDANLDLDRDGLTNLQEYFAGTSPIDATSTLKILSIEAVSASTVRLSFMAMANKSYTVEQRTAASSGAWSGTMNIAAAPNNRLVMVTNSISGGNQFFRVRVGGGTAAAGPRISSVEALDGNGVRLVFTAEPNTIYTLEFKDTLDAGTWVSGQTIAAAPNSRVVEITNVVPSAVRFFRLRSETMQ